MNSRASIFLLCFCVGILLCIIYYIKLNENDVDGLLKAPKVSIEHVKLSRSSGDFKNVVKTMGEIETRLQALENIVDRINKEKKSHKNVAMLNKVNPNKSVFGEILRGENCFDSVEHGDGGEIVVVKCHKKGGNQFFQIKDGEIKHKNFCLSLAKPESGAKVVLKDCDQAGWLQEWQYHDLTLQAAETGYCMENNSVGAVKVEQCDPEITYQQWYIT